MINRVEVLDAGTISDITRSKAMFEHIAQFHWEYYSELAFQRKQIYDSLKTSLRERAVPFEFKRWQRVVKYKYSLEPLSTRGSIGDPGGRFNIGAIDPARYPVFPALYLAFDKGTALAELLGRESAISSLTPQELALTKPDSITAVSLSGKLESVLDVRERNNLAVFREPDKKFQDIESLDLESSKAGVFTIALNNDCSRADASASGPGLA